MGWLKKLRKAEDDFVINSSRAHYGDSPDEWQRWATAHGWTYQAEAPELVGRYRPPYSQGSEVYANLMTTVLHGVPVSAFEHWDHSHSASSHRSSGGMSSFVIVRLPGLPPDDFVKAGPEKAIRQLGGTVPGECDLELQGQDLLAHHPGKLVAEKMAGDAELLAVQISVMPPDFWTRPSV